MSPRTCNAAKELLSAAAGDRHGVFILNRFVGPSEQPAPLRSPPGMWQRRCPCACAGKWIKKGNFEFSDEFLKETNELLEAFAVRVDREEKFLYPKLEAEIGKEATAS